jgi:hypothetical protein
MAIRTNGQVALFQRFLSNVRFEVFTAMTMKNGVSWDVSEELSASFIRVTRIGELGTMLAVTSNRRKSVLTRATRRNIPGDAIIS